MSHTCGEDAAGTLAASGEPRAVSCGLTEKARGGLASPPWCRNPQRTDLPPSKPVGPAGWKGAEPLGTLGALLWPGMQSGRQGPLSPVWERHRTGIPCLWPQGEELGPPPRLRSRCAPAQGVPGVPREAGGVQQPQAAAGRSRPHALWGTQALGLTRVPGLVLPMALSRKSAALHSGFPSSWPSEGMDAQPHWAHRTRLVWILLGETVTRMRSPTLSWVPQAAQGLSLRD